VVKNVLGSPNKIAFLMRSHYEQRLKSNLINLLTSSKLLGDPKNFIGHLGTGVQDFFYKPQEGFVKGPIEGIIGIGAGATSLVRNTVSGTFGATSNLLSSVSKGLLFLSDDTEYINQREEENHIDRPKDVLEGLGYGLKSTFTSISSGVRGVWEKPIEGSKRDGVKGFMIGSAKGISGLVVKPVSGTIDFFAKTSEGIRNTAGSGAAIPPDRVRRPRPFYGRLQLLRPFDELHAYFNLFLMKSGAGQYQKDSFLDAIYIDCTTPPQKPGIVVLTEERLLWIDEKEKKVLVECLAKDLVQSRKSSPTVLKVYRRVKNKQGVYEKKEIFALNLTEALAIDAVNRKLNDFIQHALDQLY